MTLLVEVGHTPYTPVYTISLSSLIAWGVLKRIKKSLILLRHIPINRRLSIKAIVSRKVVFY
jgi:hypothetical protein